jgi:hypothetical protein
VCKIQPPPVCAHHARACMYVCTCTCMYVRMHSSYLINIRAYAHMIYVDTLMQHTHTPCTQHKPTRRSKTKHQTNTRTHTPHAHTCIHAHAYATRANARAHPDLPPNVLASGLRFKIKVYAPPAASEFEVQTSCCSRWGLGFRV